uniref:Uncharacterized protein n=1 Tax=Candidatus Kentrum sp. FW TaxID=2126338 RepID=A0A450RUG0_9GAMM|nr:MAG: hypothetical protein BECKFW1821A_GA0114235_100237 [Candidatus Kentron sp. FW]
MRISSEIINQINGLTVPNSVKQALNNLEALNDISLISDEKKVEAFYRSIEGIYKKSFSTTAEELKIESLQTAKWALESWNVAGQEKNFGRMFVAYLILDYLDYPVDALQITWDSSIRKEISLKAAQGFSFDVGIPENADYSHRSQFNQLQDATKSNDIGKLLEFFFSLERGIGISGFNAVSLKFIRLIYRIHKDGIISLLRRGQPALAELILQSLNPGDIMEIFTDEYDVEHEFPLARAFVILAVHYENRMKQSVEVDISYGQMGTILEKLQKQPTWSAIFRQLTNIGILKWNPIFHYCCGLCAGKSDTFIDQYIDSIEFSLEERDYGNSFYRALIRSGNNETVLRASERIFAKYREYLKNYKGQYVLNRATSYINFIFLYVQHKSKDISGYQALLAEQFERVDAAKNSWFPRRVYYEMQILYLFIAANLILNYSINLNAPIIKKIDAFLCDERHQDVISDVPANTLIALLSNPNAIEILTVVYENGTSAELRRQSGTIPGS